MLSYVVNNGALKLLSLLFALALWVFLMGEERLEVGYTVPLELDNIPANLMVANEVPSLVDVRLSGPRTRLAALSPSDIQVRVDLSELPPGLTTFRQLEERLDLPNGVRVTRLSPSFVDIKLERVATREVPVKVVLSGKPAAGFTLGNVTVKPARVAVTGAESELKNVKQVRTDPLDISESWESFSQILPLHHEGVYTSLAEGKTVDVEVEILPVSPPFVPAVKDSGKDE